MLQIQLGAAVTQHRPVCSGRHAAHIQTGPWTLLQTSIKSHTLLVDTDTASCLVTAETSVEKTGGDKVDTEDASELALIEVLSF